MISMLHVAKHGDGWNVEVIKNGEGIGDIIVNQQVFLDQESMKEYILNDVLGFQTLEKDEDEIVKSLKKIALFDKASIFGKNGEINIEGLKKCPAVKEILFTKDLDGNLGISRVVFYDTLKALTELAKILKMC